MLEVNCTKVLFLFSGGKYTIPAGTEVHVVICRIHRHEKYFPNPDQFNPENFAFENASCRHPFAYVPFSADPRNCIGTNICNGLCCWIL